MANKSFKM